MANSDARFPVRQPRLDTPAALARTVDFLRGVGIDLREEPGAAGFVKGVRIAAGGLVFDPACRVSTLLHEAGHLAIVPRHYRAAMSGNLARPIRAMLSDVERMGLHPDHSFYRAVIQASDGEATAWAFAAGVALGLTPSQIIRGDEYGGEGDIVRTALVARCYAGINGLAAAGFCATRAGRALPAWPSVAFWTQEVSPD